MSRRLLHIIGSLNRGGAETVALDLCKRIPVCEVQQIFVCLRESGELTPEFTRAGAVVIPLDGNRVSRACKLISVMRRVKPDAIQSHISLTSGWFLALARLLGVRRRIARIHSEGDGRDNGVFRRCYRWISRKVLIANATDILAVSAAGARFVEGARREGKVCVVPNGVDLGKFYPRPLQLNHRVPVVLHVGRSDRAKNRGAIPEIARATRSDCDVRFLLVGSLESSDIGRELPDGLQVLGPRDDVPELMRNADVLLLPSLREGLPGVVLEALASGVPVVASDIAGLRELYDALPGISLVSLTAPSDEWADAILTAAKMHRSHRLSLREALKRTPFDLDENAKVWESLWTRS